MEKDSHGYMQGGKVSFGGAAAYTTGRGVITTGTAETIAGWVGQVRVDGEICVETGHFESAAEASDSIGEFVTERVKAFFTVPLLTEGVLAEASQKDVQDDDEKGDR